MEIKMSNESGLKPLGRAVLIEPYVPERKLSVIVLPDEVQAREQMIDQRAIVVEVGTNCWCDEPTPRAKVGDKVLVARFAGFMATGTKDGKPYRFVNDRDIFAAIEVE
jgi:co-chaperonin GroES (HSP10)